ncbi:MAG TPA: hypothetical protein DDW27_15190 [Bacteroidales bacterium]|nr:hypothetical protein [Bacteroidales bacterium]
MKIEHNNSTGTLFKHVSALIFFLSASMLNGQNNSCNYFYRVYFCDKGPDPTINAASLLSERAINRRSKAGIDFPDFRDLPVCGDYIDEVRSLGLTLHCCSKWLNTGLFKTFVPFNTDMLLNLPFVKEVRIVKSPADKSSFTDKLDFSLDQSDVPAYDQHLTMINGHLLHNSGFDGKGILIAVNDGGFLYADEISSLETLRSRKGIKATRDFVSGNKSVYDYHTHGTAVLSVLAGQIGGIIKGTAPGADYMLFRTEDTSDEFPVEEDFWVAAAEYADSAGADIITSSLGYAYFDDPSLNYKFSDMDGNSTFITKAADIAASKGILVFSSAGNERNKTWIRILAPSDGDSVMCIGAVDSYGTISAFSSAGPSADGRIKPDNSVMGVNVIVQVSPVNIGKASGTSFSCPVLSGISACLLQAVPPATNTGIIRAIQGSGHRFNLPDSLYGYGIPDMSVSLKILQDKYLKIPDKPVIIAPNPTTGNLELLFRETPDHIRTEIYTSAGKLIFRRDIDNFTGRYLRITALNNREQGIYFLKITTGTGVHVHKIIKLDG